MIVEDPLRKLCFIKLRNIPVQLLCIVTVVVQAYLINQHLVTGHNDAAWWAWWAADAVVIIVFGVTFFMREWRIDAFKNKHEVTNQFMKGLPFACVTWFIYAVLIGSRIIIIFKEDMEFNTDVGNLKITISITAIVCVFFTAGHHHRYEPLARRAAIISLVRGFTIDLLDTADIYDVLFITAQANKGNFPDSIEDTVLAITLMNLIRPSFNLWGLFLDHFSNKKKSLAGKILITVLELCLVNIPLLVIRVYIASRYDDMISVFLVKNVVAILFGIVEIYDSCYERNECEDNYEIKEQASVTMSRTDNQNNRSYPHHINNHTPNNEGTPNQNFNKTVEF